MFNDVVPLWRQDNGDEPAKAGERGPMPETKRLETRLHRVLPSCLRFSREAAGRAITRLRFDLPERAVVSVAVHELSGRRVRLLAATVMESGRHQAEWDGRDDGGRSLPGGVYAISVEAANESGELYRASGQVAWEP